MTETPPFQAFNASSFKGGANPARASDIVEVNLANGKRLKGRSSEFCWSLPYDSAGWAIVSYRILTD